ncbi:MAG: ligase-associated DNA damage response endonuclease PdeM [Sphingobacteriales bacterium]|nr:MAG: ligase-associated DNA damage response endonuclease PdeM [Sphingobacteriales bacterium]
MQIELAGTTITLLPQKAMFLSEHSILIIADLHLGKAQHFRKAGIFMPAGGAAKDYQILNSLIEQYNPQQVWFLGDLFHSIHNSEWLQFEAFVQSWPDIAFTLIRGNHDILKKEYYQKIGITVEPHAIILNDLLFSHEPLEEVPEGRINIAGHIHPGCVVRGKGRQSYRLPCFHLNGPQLLMPAFGYLTGLAIMDVKDAAVFAVLPDAVVML